MKNKQNTEERKVELDNYEFLIEGEERIIGLILEDRLNLKFVLSSEFEIFSDAV